LEKGILYLGVDKNVDSLTQEVAMKRWLAGQFLSVEDFNLEEMLPMSEKEFYVSIGMVCTALALFGLLVRVFAA